ncbi:hypothetical protein U9M48_011641, partial [Paspalum notatum var. saurae]
FRERRTNARSGHKPKAAKTSPCTRCRRRRVADKTVPVSRGCLGQSLTTRQTNSAYQITTKDDYGGLEVILDVYFPPHVTSL